MRTGSWFQSIPKEYESQFSQFGYTWINYIYIYSPEKIWDVSFTKSTRELSAGSSQHTLQPKEQSDRLWLAAADPSIGGEDGLQGVPASRYAGATGAR